MKTGRYALVFVLNYFCQGLLVPVMSLLLLDKGLTITTLGLGLAAYSATAVLLEVPSGIAADLLGKKRVFLISLQVTSAACLLILPGFGPLWTVGGLALYGAGRALSSGTMEALFISRYRQSYGPDSLPKGMKLLSVCESTGLAAGSLLGGVLPAAGPGLQALSGPYDLSLMLRVALSIVTALLAAFLIQRDVPDRRGESALLKRQLREASALIRGSRNLQYLLMAVAGLGFVLALLEVYWQPRLFDLLGGGKGQTVYLGLLSLAYFVAVAGGSLLADKVLSARLMGEKALFLVSRGFMALALAAVSLISHPVAFAVLYCLLYLFLGASNVAEGSIFHQQVPDSQRASFLSTQSLLLQAGFLTASSAGGALVGALSIPGAWGIGAGVALLALLPSLHIRASKPASAAMEANGRQV